MVIRKTVHVKRDMEAAFRLFVDELGQWWPLHTGHYSYGGDRAQDIFLEARVGGRFYERFTDGEEFVVGQVTSCDRPRQIVFSWGSPDWAEPTQVDVRFTAEGDGTRVDLEHSGWDRAGKEAAGMGAAFESGWDDVLSCYVQAAV